MTAAASPAPRSRPRLAPAAAPRAVPPEAAAPHLRQPAHLPCSFKLVMSCSCFSSSELFILAGGAGDKRQGGRGEGDAGEGEQKARCRWRGVRLHYPEVGIAPAPPPPGALHAVRSSTHLLAAPAAPPAAGGSGRTAREGRGPLEAGQVSGPWGACDPPRWLYAVLLRPPLLLASHPRRAPRRLAPGSPGSPPQSWTANLSRAGPTPDD